MFFVRFMLLFFGAGFAFVDGNVAATIYCMGALIWTELHYQRKKEETEEVQDG